MKKVIASVAAAAAIMLSPLFSHQASANIGDKTLKPAMTSTDVRQLQNLLKIKGYYSYSGSYTTYYGSSTTSAVKRFQSAKRLTADGISGRNTYNAMGVYKVDVPRLISTAKQYMGVPYRWGGMTPSGFDCSGLIYYVYQKQGIILPRTSSQLYSNIGLKTSAPVKGDLVFFNTGGSGVSHVGIYIGNNQFINSSSSHGVSIASLSNSYWKPRYMGCKTL
ncbi:Putative peptidoglycan binding domain-containing protein [Bacillus sp. OV322]|nr:NlpC/P60 family protein [Bacillus sp. OV322]SFC23378.1 Putative peptidoglycan binding domain-containing protein [Bacillus sp. OV322]